MSSYKENKKMWDLLAEGYNALDPENKKTGKEMSQLYKTAKTDEDGDAEYVRARARELGNQTKGDRK